MPLRQLTAAIGWLARRRRDRLPTIRPDRAMATTSLYPLAVLPAAWLHGRVVGLVPLGSIGFATRNCDRAQVR